MAGGTKTRNVQNKKYTSPMSQRYTTTKNLTTKSGWGAHTVLRGKSNTKKAK